MTIVAVINNHKNRPLCSYNSFINNIGKTKKDDSMDTLEHQ